MVTWSAVSLMWIGAVGYDLCQRVSTQASMSRDVERDLDQGFVAASCLGPQCASGAILRTQSWSGIAGTYLRFGSGDMALCVFGPPAALLIVGLGAMMVLRRRQTQIG